MNPAMLIVLVALLAAAPAAGELPTRRVERNDPALAAGLYCTAARAGNAEAAFALGRMYLGGRGVRRNAAQAAAWLERAARLGKREAWALVPEVGRRVAPDCREYVPTVLEPPPRYVALVREAATRHGVDPRLVLAIMRLESGFDPRARSPKGAMGLMQLMPDTARRFGVRRPFDPAENIDGACAYLRFLLDRFDGDVFVAAAAYNAGENAVERHGGVPPYAETETYVAALRVLYVAGQRDDLADLGRARALEWSAGDQRGLFGPAGGGRVTPSAIP